MAQVPYSDNSPRISEAGPSRPLPTTTDAGLPQPSSPYAGAAGVPPTAAMETATATATTNRTRLERLHDADPQWKWKAGLRGVLLLASAIGLAGTAVLASDRKFWNGGYGDEIFAIYGLVPFAASFVWCAIALLVPLLSRNGRPVHPGAVVAIDLIFWLGLIFAIGTTVVGYVAFLGTYTGNERPVPMDSTEFDYYSDYGLYVRVANGTWVYRSEDDSYDDSRRRGLKVDATATATATTVPSSSITPPPVVRRSISLPDPITSDGDDDDDFPSPSSSSYNFYEDIYGSDTVTFTRHLFTDDEEITRVIVYSAGDLSTLTAATVTDTYMDTATAATATATATSTSSSDRSCSSFFDSCAEQDAYVNSVFRHTARDPPLALMAVVLLSLLLLLHFVLFVWACVDTHRYNRRASAALAAAAAFDMAGPGGLALLENLRQHGYVMVPAEAVQPSGLYAGPAEKVPGAVRSA